jgi:hypothetical protein
MQLIYTPLLCFTYFFYGFIIPALWKSYKPKRAQKQRWLENSTYALFCGLRRTVLVGQHWQHMCSRSSMLRSMCRQWCLRCGQMSSPFVVHGKSGTFLHDPFQIRRHAAGNDCSAGGRTPPPWLYPIARRP